MVFHLLSLFVSRMTAPTDFTAMKNAKEPLHEHQTQCPRPSGFEFLIYEVVIEADPRMSLKAVCEQMGRTPVVMLLPFIL